MKEKEELTKEDLKEIKKIFSQFEKRFLKKFDGFLVRADKALASADKALASADRLGASLDEEVRWAALAQEAAEIKAARTRTGSSGIILKESVTEIPNPCENPPKHWIKIEGPIV